MVDRPATWNSSVPFVAATGVGGRRRRRLRLVTAQPDPLSPEAQAILDAPDQPRFTGELTADVAQEIRRSQVAGRRPTVDAVTVQHGVSVEWHEPAGVRVARLFGAASLQDPSPAQALFLHGGGFTGGMAHDMTATLMADALGIPIWSVEYSLAPEAAFPVAIDEALAAYRALTAEHEGPWVIFGVSAGANLALSLTRRILDERAAAPVALGLFTPWTDLVGHGDSRVSNDGRDPVLRWTDQLPVAAAAYAGATPLDDPLVSPIYATSFEGFPPSIITTGTRDLFLSDCTRLYWAMRRSNVPVELRVWENLWHGFNTQHEVPEAGDARAEVGGFLLDAIRSATTVEADGAAGGR